MIRLARPIDLASQIGMNFPLGQPPAVIADQVLDKTSVQVAHNTVYMDKLHPSALVLPARADQKSN